MDLNQRILSIQTADFKQTDFDASFSTQTKPRGISR